MMKSKLFEEVLVLLYKNNRFLNTFSIDEFAEFLSIIRKERKLEIIELLLMDTQKYIKGIISVSYLNNFL